MYTLEKQKIHSGLWLKSESARRLIQFYSWKKRHNCRQQWWNKYIQGSILTNLSALVYDVIFADVTLTICAFEWMVQIGWLVRGIGCQPNCLRIVTFHILYEQSWHTLTTDNDFWGWMILVTGIHCVVIVAQPVNAKTKFIIIHVIWHWIACRLSYYISYMHGNGISGILIPTFGYISYHSWQFLALEFWRYEFQQKTYSK
jgi:hypothetical protein